MDNELLPEKNWWKRNWKWFLPLCVFALGCSAVFSIVAEVKSVKNERADGIAFDRTKWETKNDSGYAYRNKMLKDLVDAKRLKKLKKDEIVDLLGEPNRADGQYLFYTISQQRIEFFPVHTTTLVIKVSDGETENSVLIHE